MAVITLGAVYKFAIRAEYLQKNPTNGVERFQTVRRERYLSEREIAGLSEALAEFEREDERFSVMADSVRLLMLTGCRKMEILTLKWEFVDWRKGCLRLPESKTGAKVVPLADDALAVLKRRWDETRAPELTRGYNSGEVTSPAAVGSPWVLPALKGDGHYVGLPNHWTRVKAKADIIMQRRTAEMGVTCGRCAHCRMCAFTTCATASQASPLPMGLLSFLWERCWGTSRRGRQRFTRISAMTR